MGTYSAVAVVMLLAASPPVAEGVGEARVSNTWKHEKDAKMSAALKTAALEKATSAARQLALVALLRNALTQQKVEPAVTNSLMFEDLLQDASRLVKKAKEESAVAEEEYSAMVKVTVRSTPDRAAIDKELKSIRERQRRLGQQKVLLAVVTQTTNEKGAPALATQHALAANLSDMLRRDGWHVLDGVTRFESASPSREEIDRVANEMGADLVLAGAARFQYLPPSPGGGAVFPEMSDDGRQMLFLVKGSYALELVDARTWDKRATTSGSFKMAPGSFNAFVRSYESSAMSLAADGAPGIARSLRGQMLDMLERLDRDGHEILLTLSGATFDQVAQLQALLGRLPKVKGVQLKGDFEEGKQQYEVRYIGIASDLASAVQNAKGNAFEVTSLKNGTIEASPR